METQTHPIDVAIGTEDNERVDTAERTQYLVGEGDHSPDRKEAGSNSHHGFEIASAGRVTDEGGPISPTQLATLNTPFGHHNASPADSQRGDQGNNGNIN